MLKLTIVLVATLSMVLAAPFDSKQQMQWASWDFAPFQTFAPFATFAPFNPLPTVPGLPADIGSSSYQYQSSNGFWELTISNGTHINYSNSNGDKVIATADKFVKPGSQPSVPGSQQQQSNVPGSQQQSNVPGSQQQQSGSGTQIQIQG